MLGSMKTPSPSSSSTTAWVSGSSGRASAEAGTTEVLTTAAVKPAVSTAGVTKRRNMSFLSPYLTDSDERRSPTVPAVPVLT
ncbi:hypothetical protein GCM10009551_021520 [Nocardiopsis tropica]